MPREAAREGTVGSSARNQLLRIEEELGNDAVYPGWATFKRAG
jgi:enolase